MITHAKKVMGNQDLIMAISNAVTFDVNVKLNGKTLKKYNYSIKSRPDGDYVLKLKNPDADVKKIFKFNNSDAHASFLIDDAFSKIGDKITKSVNNDFSNKHKSYKLDFYIGKGKKIDYSELNSAVETAVKEFKAKDYSNVDAFVSKMQEFISKADFDNKKAQYNKKVAGKLYINIVNAYFVSGQYTKVIETVNNVDEIAGKISGGDKTTAKGIMATANVIMKNHQLNAHRL